MTTRTRQGLLSLLAVLPVGCAPVFSDLQSAKLVGTRHVEVTPNISTVSFSDSDGTEHVQNEVGVQVATGVHERADLRARYTWVEGVNVVGFGPKFGLVKDRLALGVPIGFAFGSDVDSGNSLQVHPTLIATVPAARTVELNGSLKYLVPLAKDGGDNLIAFNFGLGLGPKRWKLRPEVGFLINPGEEGHFTQFSLGFSFFPRR
jgi:hypothetical protein